MTEIKNRNKIDVATRKTISGISINRLIFSDGTPVNIPPDTITVIVGPNNSGKSRALLNIRASIVGEGQSVWVCKAEFSKTGSIDDLKEQLAPHLDASESNRNEQVYAGPNFSIHPNHLVSWTQGPIYQLGHYFTLLLDTATRLNSCGPGLAHTTGLNKPRDAFQMLYDDAELEMKVSSLFRDAFGVDLVIDPRSGQKIPVHVGKRPALDNGESPHSQTYLKKIRALPLLHEQGDGIKSYAAILLAIKAMPRSLILIDEPEAFLHPPQERRVGQLLADEQPPSSQLILSVHSENVIQGLLAKHSSRTLIIRLTRQDNTNVPTVLNSEQVANLWQSPILKYSNILSSLFHDGVILTEGDADCKFYEAVSTAAQPSSTAGLDFFYTYSGGKHRMPVIIEALRALRVPVRVIADADILRDETLLEKIVASLGGEWGALKGLWNSVRTSIEERKNWFRAGDLRYQIDQLLKSLDKEAVVDKSTLDAIAKLGRQTSPWAEIKSNGIPGPLTGGSAAQAKRLIATLSDVGLFVVPVGELERFVKTAGGHGPAWVEEVLGRNLNDDPELDGAKAFMSAVLESFKAT